MKLFRKIKNYRSRRVIEAGMGGSTYPSTLLQPGVPAPNFKLKSSDGEEISLSQFRGQPVILAFYPADWSPVCGDQVGLYNEVLSLFEEHSAQLLAISVDGVWCHRAFVENRNLKFPLLSDFEPKGEVSRRYGIFNHEKGVSQRALFVVDSQGFIRWSYLSPVDVNPGANGILAALEAINS